jgi:hypothetical protein
MAYKNRIRLPFELKRPQFPEERTSFRKANGVTKTLSVVIRKTYEGFTDFWPESWHQRFRIALGTARFKVQVTPFDASNSNCQTCEEASQLDLENDTFEDPLEEDTDYQINVSSSDAICCYPAVFSLTSFNSDYLDSASIDENTGVISMHTGTALVAANGILLATYRVTCPNGGYDEANVYANINGSEEGCLAPSNLTVGVTTTESVSFNWDAPSAGTHTYYWEIYEGDSPVGSPVQTGTFSSSESSELLSVADLDPSTTYYFQVRTDCEASDSNFIGIEANTNVEADTCGRYQVSFDDGTGVPSSFTWVYYRDCNFQSQATMVYNNSSVTICAQQTSPGVPVSINVASGATVTYITSC